MGAHDPGTIIKCKNSYYLFYTGQGILWKSSSDKIYWTGGGSVFANAPTWTTNAVPGFTGIFWAPDIFYLNGKYCLYYAVSTLGSQVSAIGLVTNPTLDPTDPSYQWTDQGPVIVSTNGSPFNTIDPCPTFDASGNPWLCFGSYWNGIYIVQLDPNTGLQLSSNPQAYHLAYNSSIEASYIFRHGGYYYLVVDWGSCCSGVNSTYNLRIGRSTSITGPYLDQNGVDMAANGGSLFLEGTGKFTGPGHFAVLSENGNQSFSYHYYDAGSYSAGYAAYGSPDFDVEPLFWSPNNWPYFTNDWSAVYNFQCDARDDNGQYYGLLQNGASVQCDPVHGHVLNLNGTNQYAQLPPGVAFARTFTAVVKWNGGAPWQRIFDFGYDTTKYVMLTPLSGDGKLRCDIRATTPISATQTIEAPAPLSTGVWTHVALTFDGQNGIIYVNGTPVVTNAITLSPLDVQAQTNHLGRSKFVADPYFNGQIASFRAFGRVLSPAEIVAPLPVVAQPANGSLYWPGTAITFNGSATDFSDKPLAATALSWEIQYTQDGRTNIVYGPVTGVTNGTFNIPTNATDGGTYLIVLTATDGSGHQATAVSNLSPANPPSGWSSYYPFRIDASDANGHFNGTLNGGASIQNDPVRGNVLSLSGSGQFVSFPPGIANMQTFMAWVKWNGGNAWQRIVDFGNDTNRYTILTPSAANGKFRFNISLSSIPGEQIADAPSSLPVGVWTHVAMTTDGNSVILYTNGVPVATNATDDLVPANLNATNNYFGRSQWPADPYFNGELSSVRIFSSPLSPAAIVAPQITLAQPAQGAIYQPGDTISFNGSANDFYDVPISATGLAWTVQWIYNGQTNNLIIGRSGVTNGLFKIPTSGSSATNGTYQIQLVATDTYSRRSTNYVKIFPVAAAQASGNWASYYPFTTGAQDASNYFNGTLNNGASIQSDPVRGNVLNLSGANQYVSFPAGIGSMLVFSGWVDWRGGAPWQRIFDFGQDTQRFFFLSPYTTDGNMQCAITAQASNYTQVIEAPELPVSTWTHVAVALDGRQGILYVNGKAVAVNNSINLLPSDLGANNNNFGKSQFTADPYFNGELDSVKVNSRTLSPAAIFAPTVAITQPALGALYSGGSAIAYAGTAADYSGALISPAAFTWSAAFHHDGLVDSFLAPVTGATNGILQILTTGPDSTNVFYELDLAVTDTNGNQQSTYVDILPRIASLNLATVPPGLQLSVDGQGVIAPTNIAEVAGISRTLSAPSPQSYAGGDYNFVVWSDGGLQSHVVSVPTSNAVFTASYLQPVLTLNPASQGTLSLQWPDWAAPFSLWTTTNLARPSAWTQVTNAPVDSSGMMLLGLPLTNSSSFYRLQFP